MSGLNPVLEQPAYSPDGRTYGAFFMSSHHCRPAFMNTRKMRHPLGLSTFFLLFVLINHSASTHADEPKTAAASEELQLRMHAGGLGRFVANRWGTTKAVVANSSPQAQTALVVVTPPGSQGLQYAKKFTVPGKSIYEVSWPIRVGRVDTQSVDVPYLMFPAGAEDGLIHRRLHDEFVPNYNAMVEPNTALGLTGFLTNSYEPPDQLDATLNLLRLMSYTQRQQQNVGTLMPNDIPLHGESLDPLDQLTIASSELLNYPHALEAIRIWLQRGGKLWIRLERSGIDVTRALLDDALPLSIVGETSANSVLLTLNPEFRHATFPIREVERVFDEPIRYQRVVQTGGEVLWNIDGWPVAFRASVGRGTVVVTTVDPSVFCVRADSRVVGAPQYKLIPSAEPIQMALFGYREEPLLTQQAVAQQAAKVIGYQIPSQLTAIGLTVCFPVLLLIVGYWLQRREKGERLVVALPVLAILIALPVIGIGATGRKVAPSTVIEAAFVKSVPGARHLVSDGYASIFDFGSSTLNVSGSAGTIVEVDVDPTNRDYRTLVWTGAQASHWEGLSQPGGIQTLRQRSIESLDNPLFITVTFDEKGVVGHVDAGGLTDPGDLVIAGGSPNRMSLQLDSNGDFRGTPDDVLTTGNFGGSSLVSDRQRRRAEIYASVFDMTGRNVAFPDSLSLLFWAQSNRQMLDIGSPGIRRERSLLVAQPILIEQPAVGKPFKIPSPFIDMRTLPDAQGQGFSAIFDNGKRRWSMTENSAHSFLQFQIPSVCLPFEVSAAELTLDIRAGSRTLKVSAGGFESQSVVNEQKSPLGRKRIPIPVELIRETCRSGKVYVSIVVSDLDEALGTAETTADQNDYWEISHLGLTLAGERTSASP